MAQNYTQRVFVNGKWEDRYPKTVAAQVETDPQHRFLTDGQIAAFEAKEDAASKNKPGGYAGLDEEGRLPLSLIPSLLEHNKGYYATPEALREALPSANAGDFAVVGSTDTVWIWDADGEPAGWIDSATRGAVISVNGKTGAVTITWDDLEVPDAALDAKGIVQLSSATDSEDETTAATPKAVKAVMDEVRGRAKITVGDIAPTDAQDGDWWFDTSTPDVS